MKKMLTMAAVLSASLLSLCACSSTDPPADPGEAPLQSWYKTDAYTLLLPQGFAAQEGEDGGVTLSLDGQAVGGVQVCPIQTLRASWTPWGLPARTAGTAAKN